MRIAWVSGIIAAICIVAGCNFIGPRAVRHAGINYNVAIQRTTDEQLLLNIIRLRYRDNPSFLEINSISTSYAFSNSISSGFSLNDNDKPGSFRLESVTPSFKSGYDEKPTITYQPLKGKKFVQQLLTPLSPQTLLLLYHSGWSIERLFRCAVTRLNDLQNAPTASGPTPEEAPRYERFIEFTKLLRTLQKQNKIFLAARTRGKVSVVVLRISTKQEKSPDCERLRTLLGLQAGQTEYPLVPSPMSGKKPAVIYLGTRSLMGILYYLSHGVEVSARDLQAGVVTRTRQADGQIFDWSKVMSGVFRVATAKGGRPHIAVKYRGQTFYIDDRDLATKSTFMLITQILALQSGDIPTIAPVLTIPVGG